MTWWRRLLSRKRLETDLEKELRFHLDAHAADLTARGVAPGQAERLARLSIGGSEQVKEGCRDARGTRWLEDLARDIRQAFRAFRQEPAFSVVAVAILALGIGATTVMFALVDSVLLKPLAFPNPERLVSLHGVRPGFGEFWGYSKPDLDDLTAQIQSLSVAGWTYGGGAVSAPGEPEYVDGRMISANLFATLGIAPSRGRAFEARDDRIGAAPVAILSYSFWQRRFAGSPAAIGATLIFDGKSYTVVGIAPQSLLLGGTADVYTPLGQDGALRTQNRGARFIHAVARLRPGFAAPQAQAEFAAITTRLARQYPDSNGGVSFRLQPLQQELVGDISKTLWLLMSAAGLVLSIVCVNIASLSLTRAIARERELAMRVALGANRGRLIRQCLTESAVLGIFGGLLGALLATLGLRPFVSLWPGDLPRAGEIHIDLPVLAFAMGASLLSGLFFGIAPALRVPMASLENTLRAGGRAIAGGSRRLHGAFVISEIALSFVLLVCAGMLGAALVRLSALNPGFDPHNVLTARFAISPAALTNPSQIRAAWQDVLDRSRRVPGIEFAALADIIPMREGENTLPYRATAAAVPPDRQPFALASCVTPGFLEVMRIPLLEGRFFDEHDRDGSAPVVVIDENLARHAFGSPHAVGKQLWLWDMGRAPVQIVGVVGHVRHWGLAGDDVSRVRDQLYYPFAQTPEPLLRFFSSVMSIAVRTKTPPVEMIEPLRFALRGPAGDQALYEPWTLEQLVAASLERQRFLLFLFGAFAAIALLLASLGIYGVLAYLTQRRIPEVGLRMALGATVGDVIGLVLRQCLRLVLVGLGAGVAVALAAAHFLQRSVEGVQSLHLATFAITIPILLAAALAAGFIPAVRASRVDPVTALRQE